MSNLAWKEHFKDSLASWLPPESGSELENALVEGAIPVQNYLDWAQEKFQKPVLTSAFFSQSAPDPELLKKINLPWCSSLIPLAEWDGVLLIGGLEPPLDVLPEHCRFILAQPLDLANWWQILAEHIEAPHSDSDSETSESEEPLEKLDLQIEEPTKPKLDFSQLFQQKTIDSPVHEAATEATPPSLSEPPVEDLFADIKLDTQVSLQPLEAQTPLQAREPQVTLPLTKPPEQHQPPPPHIKEGSIIEENPSLSPAPEASTPFEDMTHTHIQDPKTQVEPSPVQIEQKTVPQTISHMMSSISKRPNFQDAAIKLLTQLSSFYSKSMLIALGEGRNQWLPVLWTDHFQTPQNISPISLQSASAFKIILETEKPFHGRVSNSSATDAFFAEWNDGQAPVHLTIVPILFLDTLVGACVAFADEPQELKTLRAAERYSIEFTKSLGGLKEEIAA